MLYAPERIKPFMLHPAANVRGLAGEYFRNRNYQPAGLVDTVLEAVERYGEHDCIALLVAARQYTWSDEQLLRLLSSLKRTSQQTQAVGLNSTWRQYNYLILRVAPPAFLTAHEGERLAEGGSLHGARARSHPCHQG